jgi:hypothetical protein
MSLKLSFIVILTAKAELFEEDPDSTNEKVLLK